jgi:SAM-dependent methyltransferase
MSRSKVIPNLKTAGERGASLTVAANQEYLLGMKPDEVRRLEQQHETWRDHTERVWKLAGFRAGQTLVDLGSGPGFTSLDLVGVVGESGRVVAVDSSSVATDTLREAATRRGIANLEVITADVSRFDLSAWNPDGVFTRWLFCFLPDPEKLVRQVASGLRGGATLAVMDYWNYLALRTEPSTPLFRKVFQVVFDSFADAGGSLEVAGRLPALLAATSFRVTQIEPLCQVGRPGSPVWHWVTAFQTLYLPTLVQKKYLTRAELERYENWWREQERNENTILFAPPVLGVIGVKQ